ncbi:MAG: hypothetical protein IPH88_08130 [Bacteroidales bacterium]|nr:hypothetical protein [Bacteroidales bacterium]
MKKMRTLFVSLLLAISAFALGQTAQAPVIDKIRQQYFTMNQVDNGALNLYFRLKDQKISGDPALLAYRGASSAASAASVDGVRKKLQYFNNGKQELEQAIAMRPLDAELRFLRLATQLNAPGFLGYTNDIEADKKLILQAIASTAPNPSNSYLYSQISAFLLATDKLSVQERKQLIINKQKFEK